MNIIQLSFKKLSIFIIGEVDNSLNIHHCAKIGTSIHLAEYHYNNV